jgi:hypothetical protein
MQAIVMLSGVFAKHNSLFSAERSRPKYWSTFAPKAGFKPPFLSRVFGLPFDSTLHREVLPLLLGCAYCGCQG